MTGRLIFLTSIWTSSSNLEPFVAALGKRVYVLYVGRVRRTFEAHLEIASDPRNADNAIRKFVALINSLPKPALKLWDAAKRRDFSVGVQAAIQSEVLDIVLETETVRAAASLNARIVITVYAPQIRSKSKLQGPILVITP